MGKVTVFCPITGCTPESAQNALNDDDSEFMATLGVPVPQVKQAFSSILTPDEIQGQEAISVIIPKNAPESDMSWKISHSEILQTPDSDIKIINGCEMGAWWDFGSVSSSTLNQDWLISLGPAFFVQSHSLTILSQATRGRMTAARLWRIVMHDRFLKTGRGKWQYGLVAGVDYGAITSCIDQFPPPIPDMDADELRKLGQMHKGDVQGLRRVILDRGFWVWMRPDRFPVDTSHYHDQPSLVKEQDTRASAGASLELLPLDITSLIVAHIPSISTIMTLSTVSKTMRIVLHSYNTLPRVWLIEQAPWWVNHDANDEFKVMGWNYVKRCVESPSMRNRKRIWNVVVQIEAVANQLGY